ncbi:MAG: Wzz/FepE/Etk N-terminal domain-containing protein [Candidatus Acidiferrales bacterium]
MAPDGNDQNKMEVFTAREVRAEQRRALQGAIRPATMEKPPDLLAWWRVIRKRRWTVLTAFSVLFVTVLAGSIYEKPVYQAKALIEIDKEDPSVANPQELFQLDEVSDAYLETQYKVLASDDLAERVIHQLGLDRRAEFLPSSLVSPWRASAAPASPPAPLPTARLCPTRWSRKPYSPTSRTVWTSGRSGVAAPSSFASIPRIPIWRREP